MSDPLATYLNHHRSGAQLAIELLERLRKEDADEPFQPAVAELLEQVNADLGQLEQIIDDVGGKSDRLEAAAAWLGEKAAPVGLGLGGDSQLTRMETFESLALGVLGKRALWQALRMLRPVNPRVPPVDFEELIAKAESQYAQLESLRLAAAREALS